MSRIAHRIEKGQSYYQNKREELIVFLPETYSRVLEIGCGEGRFTANLKPDCEIWGVEMNKSAAKLAAQKMKNVIIGKYDDVASKLPNGYFDLVICNDVIEHMEDHDFFLKEIKGKMAPESYLIGSIPNVRYYKNLYELLFLKDWRYRDEGILDKTHFRFFTEKSLKNTFKQHGYRIEVFKGINSATNSQSILKSFVKKVFFDFIIIASIGTLADIRFLQFGFRIKK